MTRKDVVLYMGSQIRQTVLSIYQCYPPDAAEITRRMIFEIGEAVSDRTDRKEAALLLYAAADAVSAKIPIEDFRLPAAAPAAVAAVPETEKKVLWRELSTDQRVLRVFGAIGRFITDRFFIGFVLGAISRGQP